MTDDLANVIRKLDDLEVEETRKALGAADGETCVEAAKRVMIELDRVRSDRDNVSADRESIRKTLGANPMETTIDAAKRMADALKDYAGLKLFWHSMAVVLGCLSAKEAQVVPYETIANVRFGADMLDAAARLVKERDEALTKLKERDGSLEPRIATLEKTLEQIGEILGMEEGEGVVDAAKRLASFGHRGQAALCDMDRAREALSAGPRETCATAAERVLANARSELAGVNRRLEDARSLANAAMKERDEALEKIRTIDTAIGRDGVVHADRGARGEGRWGVTTRAILTTISWAGASEWPVDILAETHKRYRVRLREKTRLPGGWKEKGAIVLVPKNAITGYPLRKDGAP